MTERTDADLLREMLRLAEQLAASEDQLLAGQYDYLRARIAAMLSIIGERAEA